jgi:hypothetical protein
MKSRSLLLKMLVLLGFSPIYFMKLYAQQKPATTEKSVIRLKMVQEKDGERIVIDTVIENNADFDTDAFLKSKGLDIPSNPGKTATAHKTMSGCDSLKTSVFYMSGTSPFIPELHAVPPIPAVPGTPATPPLPPDLPAEIIEKIEHIKLEYGTKGDTMIIITNPENLDIGSLTKNMKQVNVYVFRHVNICALDDAEQKALKAPKPKNELQIERLNFYPNPNNGLFKLQFELSDKGTTTISIAEKSGNEVYSEKLNNFTGKYENEINLTNQPKGMYYLTVKQGKQSLVRKLVIE